MKKIFGIDSKLMQFLSKVCDLIFLNVLFIICSLPMITMGAAQAGLYSAVRTLRDDSDSEKSCYGAFFDGLKNGFLRITVAWVIVFAIVVLLVMNLLSVIYYQVSDPAAPLWMSVVGVAIVMLFLTLIPLFHSRFGCSSMQLIRNAGYLIVCNPIASLILTAMNSLPLIVFLLDIPTFIAITPLWLLFYYSVVAYVGVWLFRVSFKMLEDNFREQQAQLAEEETASVEDAEGFQEEEQ